MRRSTVRRTALLVSMLSITAVFAILGTTQPVGAVEVAGVALSVPAPWVAVAASIQFATSINWYIKMFKLFFQLVTGGGKEAACDLCDEVVTVILELDDTKDSMELEGEDLCENICPFKIQRCVSLCSRLLEAIQSSTKMPCEAIGVCESLDEFGDNPECTFSWARGCTPAAICSRVQSLPFPKCDLKPGRKKWKRVTKAMQENVGALAAAVQSLPKCGQPGAHEVFCVDEPTGIHLVAEYLGYVLIFVVATAKSVHAIETKGGDDDRQWLSFWMIFFVFTICERFTDVILSQFVWYYESKLVVLVYLIIFDGASGLYFYVHSLVRFLQRAFPFRYLFALFAGSGEARQSLQEYLGSRLRERDDDTARLKLLESASAYTRQWLKLGAEERLDLYEKDKADAFNNKVEELLAEVNAAFKKEKSTDKGGRLKKARGQLVALQKELRLPRLQSPAAPATEPRKVEELEAAAEALATKDGAELRRVRALILRGFEKANYEFVMAYLVDVENKKPQPLKRAFTQPRCDVPVLGTVLVPLEKMVCRLTGRHSVGEAATLASDCGLKGASELQPKALKPDELENVIDKTQDTHWKELEVRYMEVELLSVENVPPMDTSGRCEPFVKLSLVQLKGQQSHIQVKGSVDEAQQKLVLPQQMLNLTKQPPVYSYSKVASKVQKTLRKADGSRHPARYAAFNEKLELPVEGGAIDDSGEYENKDAPFHVLLGELWDADLLTPSDLAGHFQVPCAILMDGLVHEVEAKVTLTKDAQKDVEEGRKGKDVEGYMHGKDITVRMRLQFAP